jgi:hypothetical protein
MKNIDRISRLIAQNGASNLLIHTISGTKLWILCEKIETDKWIMALLDPMGNSVYNLGAVNNKQHLDLWMELVRREINIRISAIKRAQELRQVIRNFLKSRNQIYAKFTKKVNQKRGRTEKSDKRRSF